MTRVNIRISLVKMNKEEGRRKVKIPLPGSMGTYLLILDEIWVPKSVKIFFPTYCTGGCTVCICMYVHTFCRTIHTLQLYTYCTVLTSYTLICLKIFPTQWAKLFRVLGKNLVRFFFILIFLTLFYFLFLNVTVPMLFH